MNRRLAFIMLFLWVTGAVALARPAAMVADVTGKVTREGQAIKKASLLPADTRLTLHKATVTLVYFKNRKTQTIAGEGTFTVGTTGAEELPKKARLEKEVSMTSEASPDPLVDNPIVMGGTTVRGREDSKVDPGIHNFTAALGPRGLEAIRWETEVGGAYRLEIVGVKAPDPLFSGQAAAPKEKLKNGRYLYEIEAGALKSEALEESPGRGQTYKVQVENEAAGVPYLEQRFRLLGAEEEEVLKSAIQEFSGWAEQDPTDPVPWMLQMALYDQLDQLAPAAAAGQAALERARGTAEEATVRARLGRILEELGRWDDLRKLQ